MKERRSAPKARKITVLIPAAVFLAGVLLFLAALIYEAAYKPFESALSVMAALGGLYLTGLALIVCVPLSLRSIARDPTPKWVETLAWAEAVAAVVFVLPVILGTIVLVKALFR